MNFATGSCLCEKVRYKFRFSPISQGICYCLQCQKTGGVYGSPTVVLTKEALAIPSGALAECKLISDRGSVVRRKFCKECGTHIFAEISDVPTFITLRAATLEDFGLFVPEYLVWTKSAATSCVFPQGVPSYSENAPMDALLGTVVNAVL
jgi:hypothetical protein